MYGILAVLFSFAEIIGYSIGKYLDLSTVIGSSRCVVKSMLKLISYFITFYTSGVLLFNFLENRIINQKEKVDKYFTSNKKSFFIIWVVIFALWIPYLLRYFPGIVTIDSMSQTHMSLGLIKMTNHHPVLHTLIIGIFMNIGKIFNNYFIGVLLYSLTQILCLSGCFSYCIYYMAKKNISIKWRLATLAFFALYPVHPLYAITMWKDIPFAMVTIIFIMNLIKMYTNKDFFKSNKNMVLLSISMILVMFFRNNGAYVIILTIPFMILMLREHWKKLLLVSSICVTFYFIVQGPVFKAFNVKQVSAGEALSIPLQQFARAVKYRSDDLSEEHKDSINKFFLSQDIGMRYTPLISDSVKACFNDKAFSENKAEFISTWVKLAFLYPREYIESFLCNSFGYWYPEASYWVVFRSHVTSSKVNFDMAPIVDQDTLGKAVTAIDSLIEKRNIPVLSIMFSIGFTVWMIFTAIMFCIYKKNYKILLVYVPIIFLWLTCLASPVFAEYRYAYSLFTCLPLLLGITFMKENAPLK